MTIIEKTKKNFNNVRTELGLTIEGLAEMLGYSDRQVRRFLSKGITNLNTLSYIAYVLNISEDYLVS